MSEGRDSHPGPSVRSYSPLVPRLARGVTRIFFREIEVVGGFEASGPVVYVANHHNGLVDPLLVLAHLPGRPRFLAKSDLWSNPLLLPFLRLGRVVPIHRRQDEGFDQARNEEAFAHCREVLLRGGAIALFPEGVSHSAPGLAPLRTGAARIVLSTLAEAPEQPLLIVPVGLVFERKDRFRSRVLVAVGEPIRPEPVEVSDREAVRALTARIAAGLDAVVPGFSSWEEARLLGRAVEIFARPRLELPERQRLADRVALMRTFRDGYQRLRLEAPDLVGELADALADYDGLLRAVGLRDEQVAATYPVRSVVTVTLRIVWELLVLLPVAAVGSVLNFVPYRLCGRIGARYAAEPDQPATYKLFGGVILFPLVWLLVAAGVSLRSPAGAVAVLLVAPTSGLVALRVRERLGALWSEARALVRLRGPRGIGRELSRRREALWLRLEEAAGRLG